MTALVTADDLAALEDAVAHAFATGDDRHLKVLGYGEISSVLAWDTARGPVAVKRLPPFPDAARFDAYAALVHDYLASLAARLIAPVRTELVSRPAPGGGTIAYLVQPILAAASLAPRVMAAGDEAGAVALFTRIADAVVGYVDDRHGLDGQLSNWAVDAEGGLRYLDVSTPMLRDAAGAERLDGDVFMASLPWALRPVVRRLLLRDILAKYYDPRGVLLDFLGNLYKERLDRHLPALLEVASARVTPGFDLREVRRYYRGDARSWALLQRLRRMDRAWQRGVRRRPYPFLLPGRIDR
ncbi:MAG: hypothetical protein H6709_13835 [Kofleriaceae bacterium]|nr:hypothetical protein [Myxococcales bacterium]MCB9561992.1 hypothetical protein [Kofleriaceae bacterium]MCB9573160.1 hypothetical protein [Kofleriaceae bacterium]